jgi:insertion element IS1 protein InsB
MLGPPTPWYRWFEIRSGNRYQGGQSTAMVIREACPACASHQFKKNGHIHNGKQHHRCKSCGRQFVLHAKDRLIDEDQRILVARLLLENISLHGICRAVGVSIRWVMNFMVTGFDPVPEHLHTQLPGRPRTVIMRLVEAEADEMCTFVKKKADKRWLWLAMDRATRQIVAFHVGDRSRDSARQLWANLPGMYREEATFYTDQYEVYKGVIPAERHKAITKKARTTNHIERFNNTLRQRVSRLVRETLAFSKKLANHIGAIRYFICHYNLRRATALPG